MDSKQNGPAPAESFAADFVRCWEQLPNKEIFFILLAAWLLLFQLFGNATFGYIDTRSLFSWMWNAYGHSVKGAGDQGMFGGDGEDDQGILIPPVVLALFWWKRRQLLGLSNRVWWPGLLLLAGAVALHVAGYLIQQPRICIVGLFAGIYALMGLAWGPAWLRASFFPFFLFIFCVPIASIGEPVTFPLRLMVSKTVTFICNNLLGIDVVREGTQLFNSQHTYGFEVAAACSGLRSLMAIFALSTIYGFITFEKSWKRLLMMAAAFPLALCGNVLRMLGIIMTAEISGQAAGNYVHENWFFSLVPYVPAIVGVMVLGHWLRERPPETPTTPKTKPE